MHVKCLLIVFTPPAHFTSDKVSSSGGWGRQGFQHLLFMQLLLCYVPLRTRTHTDCHPSAFTVTASPYPHPPKCHLSGADALNGDPFGYICSFCLDSALLQKDNEPPPVPTRLVDHSLRKKQKFQKARSKHGL